MLQARPVPAIPRRHAGWHAASSGGGAHPACRHPSLLAHSCQQSGPSPVRRIINRQRQPVRWQPYSGRRCPLLAPPLLPQPLHPLTPTSLLQRHLPRLVGDGPAGRQPGGQVQGREEENFLAEGLKGGLINTLPASASSHTRHARCSASTASQAPLTPRRRSSPAPSFPSSLSTSLSSCWECLMSGPQCSPDRQSKLLCRLGAGSRLAHARRRWQCMCQRRRRQRQAGQHRARCQCTQQLSESRQHGHVVYSCVHDLQTPTHTLHLARAPWCRGRRTACQWFHACTEPWGAAVIQVRLPNNSAGLKS